MEGLIPFLLNVVKKQRPQNAYRCLSESSSGRSYHLLIGGDSVEGSSHRRNRSDFPKSSSTVDYLSASEHLRNLKSFGARGSAADTGLKQRGFTSADNFQVSAKI
ncbi:hypothetical protein ACJIZ3_001253 [Penstemon smallii]|uniref:Uncharacterized protein n=1 Tax=Penstemon smallii TaxID=265156 RepID=A0ABD3U5X3_9LAMI